MENVIDAYRHRAAVFDQTLGNQRTGAASATVGFDFQEMVCVIEVLKLGRQVLFRRAAEKVELDFTVEQNSHAAVDDFVVIASTYRRHLQIKANADPAWRERLVNSFWSDFFNFGKTGELPLFLELVVWSEDARQTMMRNMDDHHLHLLDVQITTPTAKIRAPHTDSKLKSLLVELSLVGGHALFFSSMFGAAMTGWKNAGRQGSIRDVFKEISTASLFTLKSLSKPSDPMMALVNALNKRIKELRFSADGDNLVIRHKYGRGRIPQVTPYEWPTIFRTFPGQMPGSLEEFQDALGSRRKRNLKKN